MASPTITSTATWTSNTTASTTHTPDMPSSFTTGDLLLCFFSCGYLDIGLSLETVTASSGWTVAAISQNSASGRQTVLAAIWKIADGSDTLTVTVGHSRSACAITHAIPNADAISTASAFSTSGAINPPSLSVSEYEYLSIAVGSISNYNVNTITAAPSGYSGFTYRPQTTISGLASCYLVGATGTQDPGTFTNSSDDWSALTVAVYNESVFNLSASDDFSTTDETSVALLLNPEATEFLLSSTAIDTSMTVNALAATSASWTTTIWTLREFLASDGFSIQDTPTVSLVYRLFERMSLSSATVAGTAYQMFALDGLGLKDAIRYTAVALVSEGFSLEDEASYTTTAILVAAELLSVVANTEARLDLAIALTEHLTAIESISWVHNLTAEETLALADELSAAIQARFSVDETIALADSISFGLTVLVPESFALDETVTPNLVLSMLAEERIAFIGRLPLVDGDFSAWIMNAETTGTTSYENFPVNSLFTHEGETYGLTETGLYRLEGDDDDGDPIAARIRTGDIDFGTSRDKSVPRAYLYVRADGAMLLKTISTRHGARTERQYAVTLREGESQDDETLRRVKLARGLRGTWWSFELENVDGSDFDFTGAEVLPVVLSRRG